MAQVENCPEMRARQPDAVRTRCSIFAGLAHADRAIKLAWKPGSLLDLGKICRA
jgi:hypothetical protein